MSLKKNQYACKGGPATYFFLEGDLPEVIRYPDNAHGGYYKRTYNDDTGKTVYVWSSE